MTFEEQAAAVTPEQFHEMIRREASLAAVEILDLHALDGHPFVAIVEVEAFCTVWEFARFIVRCETFSEGHFYHDFPGKFAGRIETSNRVKIVFDYRADAYAQDLELRHISGEK